MLFGKRNTRLLVSRSIVKQEKKTWNKWIDIPVVKGDLLRVQAVTGRSLAGELKSFLYKDEAFYIYYQLVNDEIRMFRFVPKNAAQGLWVNPLILNAETSFMEPQVKRIMFRCSNPSMQKDEIALKWEVLSFSGAGNDVLKTDQAFTGINRLFGKDSPSTNVTMFRSLNNLEKENKDWSPNPFPEKRLPAYSGTTSCKINGNAFSMSLEQSLDSLHVTDQDSSVLVRASAWFNSDKTPDASLVISLEEWGKIITYKGVELTGFYIEKGKWNYACTFLHLDKAFMSDKTRKIKVYIWNKGDNPVYVDDVEVILQRWN
jgi:hypothetical protein